MIADALRVLQETAVKASGATVLRIPGDERRAYVVNDDGTHEIVLPPPLRKHTVHTLEDLVAAALKWGRQGAIWHSEDAVVLIVEDDDRRDRVTLPLRHHPQFESLRELEKEHMLNQRAIVRLFRHELAGCVPEWILPKLRAIEAQGGTAAKQEIQHGRERGMREYQAELIGAKDIPEVITASVPVYDLPELEREKVDLSLDITLPPANLEFLLIPLPNDLHEAEQNAQKQIGRKLVELLAVDGETEQGVPPVFFGTP